jgi:hypothetical protein
MISFFRRKSPRDFLQSFADSTPTRFSLFINRNAYLEFFPNTQLELCSGDQIIKASWGVSQGVGRFDIWNQAKHLYGRKSKAEDFQELFLFSHLMLKSITEQLQREALVALSDVTTPDITKEARALQWLQVSLKVLRDAILSCEKDFEKVLQASFVFEKNTTSTTIRMVIFNLDITLMSDNEGVFGVVVFDDKNLGPGSAKTPALEARFRGLKPPLVDELIQLVSQLMRTAENRMCK